MKKLILYDLHWLELMLHEFMGIVLYDLGRLLIDASTVAGGAIGEKVWSIGGQVRKFENNWWHLEEPVEGATVVIDTLDEVVKFVAGGEVYEMSWFSFSVKLDQCTLSFRHAGTRYQRSKNGRKLYRECIRHFGVCPKYNYSRFCWELSIELDQNGRSDFIKIF